MIKYLYKFLFFMYTIPLLVINTKTSFYEVTAFLAIASLEIFRWKYNDSIYVIIVEGIMLAAIATFINPYFIFLFSILAFDMVYKKIYAGLMLVILAGFMALEIHKMLDYYLLVSLCASFGFISCRLREKEKIFKSVYDKERSYRYELESIKQKLINSSKEIAHIAEIKERNRIARDIHDNIGHSIAGILMQLQASRKLFSKNNEKAEELLDKSIAGLADTLTVLRDTVHNIKPRETLGIEYIKNIIDNFNFCKINFSFNGDFNTLSADYIEIISTNIKEALTNASRYSNATNIDISLEANDKFVRLYIKDNGVGCQIVKEGLGLSGMRDRIRNIGGSISISSDNGFLIVCIIPRDNNQRSGIFENIGS